MHPATISPAVTMNGLTDAENAVLSAHSLPVIGKSWLPMLETLSRIALENEISRLWRRHEQNVGFADTLSQLSSREAYNLCVIACDVKERRFPKPRPVLAVEAMRAGELG
jgi:hypothetical protein